jgi:hypothetical protein
MSTAAPETYAPFRALARLVLQSALPRPQKVVLHALLAHARTDLTVYHAQGQLAWECDYTRPIIKKALAALKAQAILRVRQDPRQHYATEYALDLSRLPSRAPYRSHTSSDGDVPSNGIGSLGQREIELPADDAFLALQGATQLPPEGATAPAQHENQLPSDHAEGHSVTPSGQMGFPRVVQQEQEKNFCSCNGSETPEPHDSLADDPPVTPTPQRPRPAATRPLETHAPDDLPLTEALHRWAAETVPGLHLERERDKFLCYARAHSLTNADWSEALKGWLLEAYARAVQRGGLQSPAVPTPAPEPEPPPHYDPALHAQMRADIAWLERLLGSVGQPMPGARHDQEPRRRRGRSIRTAEGMTLTHDPTYLATIARRREELRAQAAFLQAREQQHEAASATDYRDRIDTRALFATE